MTSVATCHLSHCAIPTITSFTCLPKLRRPLTSLHRFGLESRSPANQDQTRGQPWMTTDDFFCSSFAILGLALDLSIQVWNFKPRDYTFPRLHVNICLGLCNPSNTYNRSAVFGQLSSKFVTFGLRLHPLGTLRHSYYSFVVAHVVSGLLLAVRLSAAIQDGALLLIQDGFHQRELPSLLAFPTAHWGLVFRHFLSPRLNSALVRI